MSRAAVPQRAKIAPLCATAAKTAAVRVSCRRVYTIMTDAMLSRRDRRHDHTILPPGWAACHNLDDAGGEPDQRADLRRVVVGPKMLKINPPPGRRATTLPGARRKTGQAASPYSACRNLGDQTADERRQARPPQHAHRRGLGLHRQICFVSPSSQGTALLSILALRSFRRLEPLSWPAPAPPEPHKRGPFRSRYGKTHPTVRVLNHDKSGMNLPKQDSRSRRRSS